MNDQFSRLRLLIGNDGMKKLQNSFVIVAGLGAVGGYVTEALARAGIGRLRLIDHDIVTITNLNRQLYALHSTIGLAKTEVAQQRIKDINPSCIVEKKQIFINQDSIPDLFSTKADFVVDAIDSLSSKTDLIAYLRENKIPFISSMGAALRTAPEFIRIGKMSEVTHCRLACTLRKRLRHKNIPLDFPCVYSCEPVKNISRPQYDHTPDNEYIDNNEPRRSVIGSLPTITGIFGLMLANYVICRLYQSD